MNSKPTTASVMTGFIVDEGCLYAVLQEPHRRNAVA